MKVVNIILSILIFLLAAVSAGFSFMLFQKRALLVEGWNKMANAIHQTATEMDKSSGTSYGTKLTVEELSHEKSEELQGKLDQLVAQGRQLVKQRDELADALSRVGSISEMKNVPASAALRDTTSYTLNRDEVINGVGALVKRRDDLANRIAGSARSGLGLNLDVNKLKAADSDTLKQFADRITLLGNQRKDLENALKDISGQTGAGGLDFSDSKIKESLDKVKQSVRDIKGKLDEANRTINAKNQEIQQQKNKIDQQQGQIAALNKKTGDLTDQLNGLRKVLGIPDTEELPVPWKEGSMEARRAVLARVADISERYGYIVISVGSESTVTQPIGSKTAEINPMLAPGLEMMVSRGEMDVATAKFIAKVKLTKVDEKCSIAEPIGETEGPIKVGDYVWFDIK